MGGSYGEPTSRIFVAHTGMHCVSKINNNMIQLVIMDHQWLGCVCLIKGRGNCRMFTTKKVHRHAHSGTMGYTVIAEH